MQSPRAAIVSGVRTPFGKAGRGYADVHVADLFAVSLRGALAEAGIDDPLRVDQVIGGCVTQAGEQSVNVTRNSWLAAGLPYEVPALTLDAQCCSSQQAVNLAASLVMAGQADVVIAGGVESLTKAPLAAAADAGVGHPYPPSQLDRYEMPHQGIAGERVAVKYGVTREESDAYGLASHLRAHRAWQEGHFKAEAVYVERNGAPVLETDEGVRADSTAEKLAGLRPSYTEDGIITAGSASQLSDGSAAVVIASEHAVESLDLTPLAWVLDTVAVGADPDLMLEGPIHATTALLERSGRSRGDIDLFEVHEAYATIAVAWSKAHGIPHDVVNVDGGAVGIGHPFGASGARQVGHLAHALRRTSGRFGMLVMCGGGGLGAGTLIEVAT